MNRNTTTRRHFLKLLSMSPLAVSLPFSFGCSTEQPQTPATVSLVKISDDATAIARAIDLCGGLDFISPGDSVLLKIALNSPNPFPATTSPSLVTTLVALLKEQGAGTVYIGDKSPTWQDTMSCFEQTGLYQAAREAGAEVVLFEGQDMVAVQPAGALCWPGGFSVPHLFEEVDHIIALPTLRTHALADFTMGMKIFVGAIPQNERYAMHRSVWFHQAIAELILCSDKIRLSLLDGREGFNREGPDTGNLIQPGIIIAGHNIVAVDAVGLAVLKTTDTTTQLKQTDIWNHPAIKRGIEINSPGLCYESLTLVSEGVDDIEDIREKLS